jgi:hypothetical protein
MRVPSAAGRYALERIDPDAGATLADAAKCISVATGGSPPPSSVPGPEHHHRVDFNLWIIA